MHPVRIVIDKGQEVMETLEAECLSHNIRNAAIVSIVGAVDECCIHNMLHTDAHTPVINEYREHLEMTGSGEVRDGKPHIHCVMSRENEETLAGHLHWAKVENWFVAVYLIPLP